MKQGEMHRAREIWRGYRGNYFLMQGDGVLSEYLAYGVTPSTEMQWKDEIVAEGLKRLVAEPVDELNTVLLIGQLASDYRDAELVSSLYQHFATQFTHAKPLTLAIWAEMLTQIVQDFESNGSCGLNVSALLDLSEAIFDRLKSQGPALSDALRERAKRGHGVILKLRAGKLRKTPKTTD